MGPRDDKMYPSVWDVREEKRTIDLRLDWVGKERCGLSDERKFKIKVDVCVCE